MKATPTIKTVMTPFPYAIAIDAPIAEAQAFMRKEKIRHLPVIDGGRLAGVVSDRDIKLLLGPEFASPKPEELKVRDAMVESAFIVDLNTPLRQVVSEMAEHRLGSAIVTRNGKLAGIFTVTDACRALAELLPAAAGPDDAPDAA